MQLTGEELTAFLEERRSRIATIVAPVDVEVALAEIHERIRKFRREATNTKSLENLVDIAANDIPLRPLYTRYCADNPDDATAERLFAWRGRFVETEIRKTLRTHLASKNSVEAVLADVMMVLWKSRGTFNPEKGWFVPWARGIALNRARSYRSFDRREVSIDTDGYRPLDLASSSPSPEDVAAANELSVESEGPPSKSYVEMLRMVQEFEPHEAIAFLFNRYLRVKPEQIAFLIGESSLPHALKEFTKLARVLYPEIAGIDALLAPLAGRVDGRAEKFGQFAAQDDTIENEIGRWAAKVHRSVGGTILQMGKKFLKLVCDLSAAAHEITCFLWIRFLYSPPVALRRVADSELMRLVEIFHESYAQRALLSRNQIEWCTSDLRNKIRPGRSLNDFGGVDLYSSIKRWCNHVGLLIEGPAAAEHMLGYAYITGSLTKGKSK
jgi:DNA-directed RNA polymerase specialized sigma24 family protein